MVFFYSSKASPCPTPDVIAAQLKTRLAPPKPSLKSSSTVREGWPYYLFPSQRPMPIQIELALELWRIINNHVHNIHTTWSTLVLIITLTQPFTIGCCGNATGSICSRFSTPKLVVGLSGAAAEQRSDHFVRLLATEIECYPVFRFFWSFLFVCVSGCLVLRRLCFAITFGFRVCFLLRGAGHVWRDFGTRKETS